MLTGDPSQYRPLLDHLLDAKDFRPVYVDHTSIILRRNAARAWEPGDLSDVRVHFTGKSKTERAKFLALTAVKLLAIRHAEDAKALLDEASGLSSAVPEVGAGLALYHMGRGQWSEAMLAAERALALDRRFLPALAAKTQILFATKQFSEAYDLSNALVERLPDDPAILFYHAKIAHEAHAYEAEIRTLEKLIARAESEDRPTSGYLVYLGQACASAGRAQAAIDAFSKALLDPDLPAEQREFAGDALERIKSRTEL
jgi:tetratricopeptide (TPR) repeat protein